MTLKRLITLMALSALTIIPMSELYAETVTLKTLGCMLEPSESVKVSSPVAGVIDNIYVKRGDIVKKGKTLFRLKAGVENESVKLAKIKAEFARRKAQRNKELYEDDILTMHERDEIETELRLAQSELRLNNQQLALRSVHSPINGVVVNRFNNKGEHVNIDPILELATLDPLHIDLLLPSSYFGKIIKGQKLMIKPQTDALDARVATVTIVDPLIDSASSTIRLQLQMRNPGHKVPAGLRCTAQLTD